MQARTCAAFHRYFGALALAQHSFSGVSFVRGGMGEGPGAFLDVQSSEGMECYLYFAKYTVTVLDLTLLPHCCCGPLSWQNDDGACCGSLACTRASRRPLSENANKLVSESWLSAVDVLRRPRLISTSVSSDASCKAGRADGERNLRA